ncbi:MAG: BlaI/MecI/CopY family transcriptional regulator [Actinomycetota bacterium]|nr:BlaI/MecI/CopY family transcriptional regulator [Actinomycetota bacterium]
MTATPPPGSKSPTLRDVLGPLAAPIIEAVVARGEASVAQVVEDLEKRESRRHAYTTVMTIMSRLFERGLLAREKRGRLYVYRATNPEADLIDQLSQQAVDRVIDRYGSAAFRHFALKLADLDPELRRRLIKLASRR